MRYEVSTLTEDQLSAGLASLVIQTGELKSFNKLKLSTFN